MSSFSIEIQGLRWKYFWYDMLGFSLEILGTSKMCDSCIRYVLHVNQLNKLTRFKMDFNFNVNYHVSRN